MEPRIKTLEEIGTEDRAREAEHAIYCALKDNHITNQLKKTEKLKEKNRRAKAKRIANKSPITTCIINYLRECASKKRKKNNTIVISLEKVKTILHQHHCTCSVCEYVRGMKAAAAGAGHLLKKTHTVSFSPYKQTITLQLAA